MAEAVGIAAAAVHFIELGTKLLIAASKLRSKLENAPEKVKTSERSVRRLVSLVRTLETDLQPTSSTTLADILTNESKLEAEDILEECSKEASALLDLLHGFMIKADESFVKGKMRAFSYVKKEDEVAERCKRLDDLSSRLVLWYHHQTLSLQRTQLDALFSTNNAINAIGSQIHAGFAAVTHSLQQQQDAMTLSPSAPITPIDSFVSFHRRPRRGGLRYDCLLDCTCKRSHLMKSTFNAGPFSLMSKQSGVHERSCPYYGKHQARDSRITIAFPLSWLFSQRIHLSFASSYSNGAYSISPNLQTVNIVDTRASPAFNHLESAGTTIMDLIGKTTGKALPFPFDTALICPLQEIFKTLLLQLEQDFRGGLSSAMDVSDDGTSMLHYLFEILGKIYVYQDHLIEPATSILQLLIDFGIDINTESQEPNRGALRGRNTLLRLANLTGLLDRQQENTSIEFINLLYRTGIDVPTWDESLESSFLEPKLFPKLPDLAFEVGFPKLTFAVISRDERRLRALLRAKHNVHEIYIQPFTPICYSIGWPEGCQILLEFGADPNTALAVAFKYLDVAVIKRLLEAGCALFTHWSALEQFLWETIIYIGSEGKRSEILSLIVNAMVDFRLQFMRFARENAPRQALIQCGWTDPSINGPLLDGSAVEVAELLDNLNIQIPLNLDPGFRRSVYHAKHLTVQAAQLLYSCGFRETDLPGQNGCTPFMLCLIRMGAYQYENLRTIPMLWFLDQGISIFYFSQIPGFSLLHLLSTCFGTGVISYTIHHRNPVQELDDLDIVIRSLSKLCNPYSRDLCKCWCSSGGCLPLTLLFKRLGPRRNSREDYTKSKRKCTSWGYINQTLNDWMRWYGCNTADQTLLEGVCRLEVFQRLGMAHTCCKLWIPLEDEWDFDDLFASFVSDPERQQFQEEDTCSKIQLDALLDTYTALFTQYSDSVARFWMVWWEILEDYLPQTVWIVEKDGGEECEHEDEDEDEFTRLHYVTLENPWCNSDLPEPQDLWTKTDEIKSRVIAAMNEPESRIMAS